MISNKLMLRRLNLKTNKVIAYNNNNSNNNNNINVDQDTLIVFDTLVRSTLNRITNSDSTDPGVPYCQCRWSWSQKSGLTCTSCLFGFGGEHIITSRIHLINHTASTWYHLWYVLVALVFLVWRASFKWAISQTVIVGQASSSARQKRGGIGLGWS